MGTRRRLCVQRGGDRGQSRAPAPARRGAGHDPRPGHVRRPGVPGRHEIRAQAMTAQATAPPPIFVLSGGRRRRSRARRLARAVSSLLIACGLLLLTDAGLTLVWQEPVTGVIGLIEREQIDKRLLSYRTAPLSGPDRLALGALASVRERIAYLAARERRLLAAGDAVGVLRIPRLGGSFVVVQGTDAGSLQRGPGHYTATALPGMGRTVAMAGHRTTYLAPFRHLDVLHRGDQVTLQMPYGHFVYRVQYQ